MTSATIVSWRSAAALGMLAVYGPFLLMALYTLAFVSCGHCKTTVWMLLPCAPGLFPVEGARQALGVSRWGEGLTFVAAFAVSLTAVGLLMRLVRRGGRLRWIVPGVAFVAFSFCAFGVLSMIRA